MTTDDKITEGTIDGARLKIGPLLGNAVGHAIAAPPMQWGIKLTPEARRTLLDAIAPGLYPESQEDLENTLGRGAVDVPEDRDWVRIEEALTEILMPPQRWITGPPPSADSEWFKRSDAGTKSPVGMVTFIPDVESQSPVPADAIVTHGHLPKPPAGGALSIQMVIDSHPERQQQALANRLEEDVRFYRERSPRSRHSW